VAVGGEGIVHLLHLGAVQPEGHADSGLGRGGEVGARHDVAQREGNGLGLEDDGVRRPGGRTHEAEILLVERLRGIEVAYL
jgi:hypothetical protein